MNAERRRLREAEQDGTPWKKWGPYLTERQWGTVREDYSPHGTAWDHVTHDMARSKAYRWGEEGIAGFSDDHQLLCFGLGLWNGRDPILKERLYGVAGNEGNHGEDVKELYYYLDATPTHSYSKMLYKYPQEEFPYHRLATENRGRGKGEPELELIDTGIFDDDRYFDVFAEYAKAGPEDLLVRITVHNRGREAATLHLLPQLWFRNTWEWQQPEDDDAPRKPVLTAAEAGHLIVGEHYSDLDQVDAVARGPYWLAFDRAEEASEPEVLFCENESNTRRLYGVEDAVGPFKDGINDYVVGGRTDAVHQRPAGTKAAIHYRLKIAAGGQAVARLRFATGEPVEPFGDFDQIFARRHREADAFYREVQAGIEDADALSVQRQAFAGMLWTKQFYYFDVDRWLHGDPGQPPPPPQRRHGRNSEWFHLNNADIISMPDKWEYPWYAAWDLAFHCLPLALVDVVFAKEQLVLMTREWYMHPNGQLPAYEWAFGDVNPPVHAWATWRVFQIDRKQRRLAGAADDPGDLDFLERVFHKLLLNFTWWVNRKDTEGHNIFQGGFLGLDNIGVFDRSAPLPTGGHIHQADGTSWMAMYSLNLMRIALALAKHRSVYEDIATKFFEHFLYIAKAMTNIADEGIGLWDEEDEFYYDVLHLPDGRHTTLRVRSMVGLIPLFAVETIEPESLKQLPGFAERLEWFLADRPDLANLVSRWFEPGRGDRRLLSLLRGHRMKRLLKRMLDETEFLSDYGVRALSRAHAENPYRFEADGNVYTVSYRPAESDTGLFGGNSNWRGPIWFPVNYLIIESLQKFHHYYGGDFKVECPTGSGQFLTLDEVAAELGRRLTRIFLLDADGRRPVYGGVEKIQRDPHFRDHVLFYEYFHGDNGRGVGASHQTGWTGLVAKLLAPRQAPRASHKETSK